MTLSSRAVVFYGVVEAACKALGQQSLLKDLGVDLALQVWTDSQATPGICSRSGLGKLGHLETRTVWVQAKIQARAFDRVEERQG